MRQPTLTREDEQVLRDQVIDLAQPGPVLRDFQTVLDFIGPQGVKAAGKYNLLPLDAIPVLDERLGHPLRLNLKRPQLRSHPYLQGLHLLLRASALTRVEGTGDRTRLVVDPAMLEQWQGLNPTERYFNLLEAWLRAGQPEMIGERGRDYPGEYFSECLTAWRWVQPRGSRKSAEVVPYLGRDTCVLALMDLFGLLHVQHPAGPVERWAPTAVRRLPFGDAALGLLWTRVFDFTAARGQEAEGEEPDEDDEGGSEHVRLGRWQSLFQPYFPEWQRNLVPPAAEFREGVYVFRVKLGDALRRIAMPADADLGTLASLILKSVRFDNDHLYEFVYRDRLGTTTRVKHPYCDEGPWTDEVRIGDLPLNPGQSMTFRFDFGDDWRFDVLLERIEPAGAEARAPKILEKKGKAPEQYGRGTW